MLKNSFIRKYAVFSCLLITAFLSGCPDSKSNPATYEFVNINRGTLERTVSASGAINPVSTVRVLPRMSGKVEKIFVDYNDTVKRGDILAELNTDMLRLRRDQQRAAVNKARANHQLQRLNFENQQALAERNLISEYDLLSSRTTLNGMAADLAVAESNLRVIETEINQYAFITSPIDGIVLDRRINVGDTVVDSANSNSSSIFTLAENLREMQIEANVGELDIASIHKGQSARFTLESLPRRTFTGEVESVRLVPVVSNNVVSYTVIVKVENPDGALLPGMTCAVDFIVERSEDVLMIPNAALRYQPSSLSTERIEEMVFYASLEGMSEERRQAAIEAREQARAQAQAAGNTAGANTGLAGMLGGTNTRGMMTMTGGGGRGSGARQQGQGGQRRGAGSVVMRNLWFINDEGRLEIARVQTGITNGTFTEIISPDDVEGKQIILRERI